MKKRVLAIFLVIVVSLLIATPCFATDPPDTDVDVTVVTIGDVDLGVDIYAGGSVSVVVGGYDMSQIASQISQTQNAFNQFKQTYGIGLVDIYTFGQHWDKKMQPYNGLINNMQSVLAILSEAQAKLIQGYQLTNGEVSSIRVALSSLSNTVKELGTMTNSLFEDLRQKDSDIYGQLISTIDLLNKLQSIVDEKVVSLQSKLDAQTVSQKSALETANSNITSLQNHIDYLNGRYLLYLSILGGCAVVLLGLVIWSLVRKHSRM